MGTMMPKKKLGAGARVGDDRGVRQAAAGEPAAPVGWAPGGRALPGVAPGLAPRARLLGRRPGLHGARLGV